MRYQLLLFFAVLIIFSCSNDENLIVEPTEVSLELLIPSENAEVNHCCLSFEWEPLEDVVEYRFNLSLTEDLGDIILDTIVESNSLFLESFFIPGLKYYWHVDAIDSDLSAESSFTVIDYGEKYSGQHTLIQKYRAWLLGEGTTEESTSSVNVSIQEMINPLEDIGFIRIGGKRYKYIVPSVPNQNEISFHIEQDLPHKHDFGTINLLNDSIFLSDGLDANGGGYTKTTTGSLIE